MSRVSSASESSTPYNLCNLYNLNRPPPSKYIHCVAKDSDSDSEVEEPQRVDDEQQQKATTAASKLTRGPPSGVRFCRVCNAFLPSSMFPADQRRSTCRPHLWQRAGKKSRQAVYRARPRKRLLASIWARCWKDAEDSSLGLPLASTLALTQADIGVMLDALEARQSRSFSLSRSLTGALTPRVDEALGGILGGMLDALEAQWSICIDAVAVLPADLSAPISRDNAVLVTKETRRVLLDKLRRTREAVRRNSVTKPEAACEEKRNHLAFWHRSIQAAALFPPEQSHKRADGGGYCDTTSSTTSATLQTSCSPQTT